MFSHISKYFTVTDKSKPRETVKRKVTLLTSSQISDLIMDSNSSDAGTVVEKRGMKKLNLSSCYNMSIHSGRAIIQRVVVLKSHSTSYTHIHNNKMPDTKS